MSRRTASQPEPWRLPDKPLQLERQQDYADRAVVGGIAALVGQWAERAAAAVSGRELRNALAQVAAEAARYPDLGLAARKALIAQVQQLAGLVEQELCRPRSRPAPPTALTWDSPLSTLPGIGPVRSEQLAQAGLATIGDLLRAYPFRYEDRREPQPVRSLQHRQSTCLLVEVTGEGRNVRKAYQQVATVPASDGSDPVALIWFNQPYRATQFAVGTRLVVTGQVRVYKGTHSLAVTEVEVVSKPPSAAPSSGGPPLGGPALGGTVGLPAVAPAVPASSSAPDTAGRPTVPPEEGAAAACAPETAGRPTVPPEEGAAAACAPATAGRPTVPPGSAAADELHVRRIVPVYSAPPFSQVVMRRLTNAALEACTQYPETRVPAELVARRGLMPLAEAYREVHFPSNHEVLREARARLAYDELFFLQVRLAQRRRRAKGTDETAALDPGEALVELRGALPFSPTAAQERVMGEVLEDLRRPEAASRLIHGDVGAGKTVIAALALLAAVRAGKQGAMMAPTELLARQHHRTLGELLGPLGLQPALLLGSMPPAEKRQVRQDLLSGECRLAVGTHALFSDSVAFADLGVAVIDEQHRFGVRQRALLIGKGRRPNCFIMSATPIPRTLALTAFGDFDISILDQLPPGRIPVHTQLLTQREVKTAYQMVSDVVERGQQAYLVCPVIEENESRYLLAAETVFNRLKRGIFPSLRLGLVHGRQDSETREQIMESFRAGELEALVATTVIEVGVDVPNATVMVIMNPERFGLAQLHQLRGRVARSSHRAWCLLVTNTEDLDTIERLQVLERTNDGFLVAEEDLRRRGPGEMAGLKQAGLPDLRMADLLGNTTTLAQAREDAFALIDEDAELAAEANAGLKAWLGPEGEGEEWTL